MYDIRMDKDIRDMLAQVEVPEHRPDLPERIIAAAMVGEHAGRNPVPQVKTGGGFSAWWGGLRAAHGPKLAVAASLAAVAVIVLDPAGRIAERYIDETQVAAVQDAPPATDRYTVGGVSLLADISLVEEPDLEMEMALLEMPQ